MIREARDLRLNFAAEVALDVISAAVELHPDDCQVWLEAAFCYRAAGNRVAALDCFTKATKARRGHDLAVFVMQATRAICTPHGVDEAVVAQYDTAQMHGDIDHEALERLLDMYKQPDVFPEGQTFLMQLLHDLDDVRELTIEELEWLGDLYEEGHEAIEHWSAAARRAPNARLLFKLGCAYASVGKYADAVDYFRLTLDVDPEHEGGEAELNRACAQMIGKLAEHVSSFRLPQACWGRRYLNPYALLKGLYPDDVDSRPTCLDEPTRLNLHTKICRELERHGGALPWLPGFAIDPARAKTTIDELACNERAVFHHHVFQDVPLLEFLQQGSILHFTKTDRSLSTLRRVATQPRFQNWLGIYLAVQIDTVRAAAVAGTRSGILRALLWGRNWIGDHDPRVNITKRALARSITHLKQLEVIEGITEGEIDAYFEPVVRVAKSLPPELMYHAVEVSELAAHLANTWLSSGKLDHAKYVCQKASTIAGASNQLNPSVEHLIDALYGRIRDREDERDRPMFVTSDLTLDRHGVRKGEKHLRSREIAGMRWGYVTGLPMPGAEKCYRYAFRSTNGEVMVWLLEEAYFRQYFLRPGLVIDAALAHLAPPIVRRITDLIVSGESVQIGPCTIARDGIAFSGQGLLRPKQSIWRWDQMCAQLTGDVVVISPLDGSARPLVIGTDTDFNVMVIPRILQAMQNRG